MRGIKSTDPSYSRLNFWNKTFLWILALSLLLKLALWFFIRTTDALHFLAPDSAGYQNNALALLKGAFATSPDALQQPETFRTPGYPLLIAALYGFFKSDPPIVILLQIVISSASMALVYGIGETLWGKKTALVAVVLFVLDLGCFAFTFILLTETFFMFLLLCALAFFIPMLQDRPPQRFAFLAGLFLALAAMVRPVGYFLFFPLFAGILFRSARRLKWSGNLSIPLFFLIPFALIVGAWQIRNYMETGSASFSRIQSILLMKKSAEVVASRDKITYEEAQTKLQPQNLNSKDPRTWATSDQYWSKEGFKYLVHNPAFYFRKEIRRTVHMLTPAGFEMFDFFGFPMTTWPVGDLRRLSARQYIDKWVFGHPAVLFCSILMLVHLYLLYAAVFLAIWFAWRNRPVRPIHKFYGAVFLYFLAVSVAIGFRSRFLLPAMPLLHLYAARTFVLLHHQFQKLPANVGSFELQH